MTTGSLPKNILRYSLPLVCSNLLQVLFNLADVAVVGQFAGAAALGSVGSTTILVMLTTGILQGIAGGVNAVTAVCIGARERDGIRRSVHTAALLCLGLGILLLLAGIFLTMPILRLIGTKEELIGGARVYLTLYLMGSPALALYNFGSAVLNAAGDTRRPLIFLSLAGGVNIALNLLFVIGFGMDTAGVALASVLSQYLSAFLILRFLLTCGADYGLNPRELRPDANTARRILAIGVPSAIQNTLFAVANLYIQSAINSFDPVVVEGNSAAANADNIVYDIMAAFYTACTSFLAQNLGAGRKERILPAYLWTLLYSGAAAVILGGLLVIFRTEFLSMFTRDAEVIAYGRIRLGIMGCSYFISAFMDDAAAAARGLGKSVIPTVIVIMGSVVYRIIWVCTVFAHFRTLPSLYLVYCTAWTFTAVFANLYFARVYAGCVREPGKP